MKDFGTLQLKDLEPLVSSVDLNTIKKEYSFIFESLEKKDLYFCNCGHISEQDKKEDNVSDDVKYLYEDKQNVDNWRII